MYLGCLGCADGVLGGEHTEKIEAFELFSCHPWTSRLFTVLCGVWLVVFFFSFFLFAQEC